VSPLVAGGFKIDTDPEVIGPTAFVTTVKPVLTVSIIAPAESTVLTVKEGEVP
jgi:hypothetical protein